MVGIILAKRDNGVFPKWKGNSVKSANSGNLNWTQFKDLVCYLCFAGTMVTSWSLACLIVLNKSFNNIFCHSIHQIKWKHFRKTQLRSFHSMLF